MSYSTLISTEHLQQAYDDCVVVDCRFALNEPTLGETLYWQGHLPKARYADLDKHLSSPITPTSGRHPLPDFEKLMTQLGQWGIDRDTQVITYDDMSGFFASRLWWLMKTLGHQHVAVLDGGMQAWQAISGKLETNAPQVSVCTYSGQVNRGAWWDVSQLQQNLSANDCVLIDVRAKERFDGTEEPIDSIAGHIPGALNIPITELLDEQGKFLQPGSLRQQYQRVIGSTMPNKVVHSCGSGVFACFGILAMEAAGLSGAKLYPGSWSEWIRDPKRGIETNT